jgi:hypothetical protein
MTTGSGITPIDITPADALSITTGGVSQPVFNANPDRLYLLVQNVSDENLWVRFGADAEQGPPSALLLPGGLGKIEFPDASGVIPTAAVNIVGATAGKEFVAWEGEA